MLEGREEGEMEGEGESQLSRRGGNSASHLHGQPVVSRMTTPTAQNNELRSYIERNILVTYSPQGCPI